MTPADKLEALEAEMRRAIAECAPDEPTELIAWANRLAAIRAELGEAGPTHWMVSNEVFTSLSEAIEEIQQWGPSGSIAVPLYTTPPASVPVEALREYCEDLNARAEKLKAGPALASERGGAYRLVALELAALIAAQVKP